MGSGGLFQTCRGFGEFSSAVSPCLSPNLLAHATLGRMVKRYYPRSGKRRYYKRRSGVMGYLSRMRITDMLILALIGIAGISWAGKKLGLVGSDEPLGLTSVTSSDVYYQYCRDARAAGAAPLYRGDPGYRPALDADNDGVACEPYYGR